MEDRVKFELHRSRVQRAARAAGETLSERELLDRTEREMRADEERLSRNVAAAAPPPSAIPPKV